MPCKGYYKIGWGDDTPDTFSGAKPTDYEEVENCRVIHITNGFYRGSWFSGIFELVEKDPEKDIIIQHIKGNRVRVLCHWFCCRPKTRYPDFTIENAEIRVEENYKGEVIRNIGT